MPTETAASDLPENVQRVLTGFVDVARTAFGSNLRSAVLYGSGAEGRLRPTSDVNLILVLSSFDRAAADAIRQTFAAAEAAIRLRVLFLLEAEIAASVACFAQKFADVRRRRRVLFGPDPFASIEIPRPAAIARLKQVLLNLAQRLREQYVARSLREEQLLLAIAEATGPLRTCAASLLELEGHPASSAKEALAELVRSFAEPAWPDLPARLSAVRESRVLAPGEAAPLLFQLIDLASRMRRRAEELT